MRTSIAAVAAFLACLIGMGCAETETTVMGHMLLTEGGKRVNVDPNYDPRAHSTCRDLGRITVRVTQGEEKAWFSGGQLTEEGQNTLQTRARNEAGSLGADIVVARGSPYESGQEMVPTSGDPTFNAVISQGYQVIDCGTQPRPKSE